MNELFLEDLDLSKGGAGRDVRAARPPEAEALAAASGLAEVLAGENEFFAPATPACPSSGWSSRRVQ